MRGIPLTQGKVAIVDDEDYERLSSYKWCAWRRSNCAPWYAVRDVLLGDGKRATVRMHREILGLSPGRVPDVDHRNGDGLDNKRHNLRTATHSQNMANGRPHRDNHSGFKGVCWCRRDNKWRARIAVNRKEIHLGRFDTLEAAAGAYCLAAERHFGDFAYHRRDVETS